MKVYKHIFIKFYRFEKKLKHGFPEYFTVFLLSFFLTMGLKAILYLLVMYYIPKLQFLFIERIYSNLISVFLLTSFYTINYFVFIKNKKFLEIENEYEQISNREKILISILTYLYLFIPISLAIFVYYLIFTDKI